MTRGRIHLIVWASAITGFVLLMWPASPHVALWDLPGVFGGGSYTGPVVTPLGSLFTGEALVDGFDRLRLAVGLILAGMSVGAGVALLGNKRKKAAGKTPATRSGFRT